MTKKVIRLTENDFFNMINNSVRKIIRENYMIEEPSYKDMIDGFYENGAERVSVEAEKSDNVVVEITGSTGTLYFLHITLNYNYNEIPQTYEYEGEVSTSESIENITIEYYDDENNKYTIDYIKDEDFENELLDYIDVDYSFYDPRNHDFQFPY